MLKVTLDAPPPGPAIGPSVIIVLLAIVAAVVVVVFLRRPRRP